jgi:hypothetical protein
MWISFRSLEEDIVAQFVQMAACHSYCSMSLFPKGSKKESYNSQMNAIEEKSILLEDIKSAHCHFLGMKTRLLLVN